MLIKSLISLLLIFAVSPAFGAPTKFTHKIKSVNLEGYDIETGEKKSPPKERDFNNRLSSIFIHAIFDSSDNTRIQFNIADSNPSPDRFFINAGSFIAARTLKEFLVNSDEALVLLYDISHPSKVISTNGTNKYVQFVTIDIEALYVWNDSLQSFIGINQAIGISKTKQNCDSVINLRY